VTFVMVRLSRFMLVGIALLCGLLLARLDSQVDTWTDLAPISAADETEVRDFYAGLNRYLSSGDRSVAHQLAPDFVDHSLVTHTDRNEEAMFATLAGAAELSPTVRFVVEAIEPRDSMVAVTLRFGGVAMPTVAGRMPELGTPPLIVDFLRIERSLVLERWSNDHALPVAGFSAQTEFMSESAQLMTLRIERWTIDPYATITMFANLPVVFAVETGSVRVDADGVDAEGSLALAAETLTTGGLRIVDPEGKLVLRSQTDAPTVVWVMGMYLQQPQLSVPLVPGGSTGVTRAVYAFGTMRLAVDPTARFRLSVTRISLPGGTILPPTRPELIELSAVVAGELHVSVGDGFVSHCSPGQPYKLVGESGLAIAGEGFAASKIADSMAGYQVAGALPGTVIIATLEPVSDLE
jgi:hypothetical protein